MSTDCIQDDTYLLKQLEAFNNYLQKDYVNTKALFEPKLWAEPVARENAEKTFFTTNCSAEMVNAKLQDGLSKGKPAFQASVRQLHRKQTEYEINIRYQQDSSEYRQQSSHATTIKRATRSMFVSRIKALHVAEKGDDCFEQFLKKLRSYMICLGKTHRRYEYIDNKQFKEWMTRHISMLCWIWYVEQKF